MATFDQLGRRHFVVVAHGYALRRGAKGGAIAGHKTPVRRRSKFMTNPLFCEAEARVGSACSAGEGKIQVVAEHDRPR